jgi:tetratricopeptide (TPR) repeat protein
MGQGTPLVTALQTGTEHHAAGRFDEAERAYVGLIEEGYGAEADVHHLLALVRDAKGDLEGALSACDAARRADAVSPDLLILRADLLRRLTRLSEALSALDELLVLDPHHGGARSLRGVVLLGLQRFQEALDGYDASPFEALSAKVLNNRGTALEGLGRLEEAHESYAEAAVRDPTYALARHNDGSALFKLGRFEEALASFDAAIELRRDLAETYNFRGAVLQKLDRFSEALENFERAIALRPSFPDAWSNRSIALRALGRLEEAKRSAEEAVRLKPDFVEAMNSLGSAFVALRRFPEALEMFRRALSLSPDYVAVHLNLGLALEMAGDLDGALTHLERAAALDPGSPEPIYAAGLVRIRQGDLQTGFRGFEVRWSQLNGPTIRYPRETLWLGEGDISGKTVMVHAEQGLGDVIQFCRFAPLLADRGARVVMEVQPSLVRLIASLPKVAELGPLSDTPPPFDLHLPVMSLVLALGLELKDVRPSGAYLAPPEAARAVFAAALPKEARPRVGLAWSGNPKHRNDGDRSMALAAFAPLFELDVDLVALQREFREADLALLATGRVKRFDHILGDFGDTAALIERCDLVLSVDTSVAHLAGALAAPTLLLLPTPCDWRWMQERADTPWYPSVTLLRQNSPKDWTPVVADVVARVAALARR